MTQEEFEAKRADGIGRVQKIQEDSRDREKKYKDKGGIIGKIIHFLASGTAKMAESMEKQLRDAKYK